MTTYSISLDDVDLALLPLRTHKYNDFLKKEHFQFELMKKDPGEESSPTPLYKCHICAIEVPAAFASEHAASVKHRANARIASEAARRTRELISALPPPAANKPPGRFCGNCATAVGKSHDKTKEHRVAVMHDKLLLELMNAYVGEDHDGADSSEASDFSETECFTYNKQANDKALGLCNHKCKNDVKREEAIGSNSTKTKAKDVNIKTTDKPIIKVNTKASDDEIETDKSVIVEAATKNDQGNATAKPTEFKVEHVEFVTKNNELVKVSIDHYHSFVRRTDKIECIVCKTTFNSEDAQSHMFSVKHLNLMPSTMIDEHCVRKISDVYSHCLLCNQTVKNANVTKHNMTAFHGERKKHAVTGYTKKRFSLPVLTPEATIPTTSFWDPINRYMEDMSSKINQDTDNSAKGQTKNIAQEKVKNITVNNETHNTSAQKVQNMVENNVKDYKTIVKPTPEDKVETTTNNRGVTIAEANNNKPSKNTDDNENNISEYGGQKTTVDWPVIYPYEVIDQDNAVRCVICDCKVPNTPGNRKTHLKGSNHIKNVRTKRLLNPYEASDFDGRSWFVRCVICDCRVLNTSDEREDHLSENRHILNAMQCEEDDN